jgi:hypothetical protein
VSVLLDGRAVATRSVGTNERSVFVELDGSEASKVRLVFDEVYEDKDPLAVSEAAILGDGTDGTQHDLAELKKTVDGIKTRLDKSSSGEAVGLLNKIGAPILGDQVGDQRCIISLEEGDLDGQPGNEYVLRMTFEYKQPDPPPDPPLPQKRQIQYAIALGALDSGKLVYLGTDYLVQEGRDDGFDAGGTSVDIKPLHRAGVSDIVFRWAFASGADATRSSGMRAWSLERGFLEPLIDVAFSRGKDSDEKVEMRESGTAPSKLEIAVNGEAKSTLAFDQASMLFH